MRRRPIHRSPFQPEGHCSRRAAAQRRIFSLVVLLVVFVGSGASCPWMLRQPGAPIPQVLPQAATLDQVITAVNENTARARTGVASQAYLTVPGAMRLSAELAFETPRRFHLKAGTRIAGEEVDLGLNEELFWLWVRRGVPPAMYFCRHDQFAQSNARRIMPVEPEWLVEALGLPTFQPYEEHTGPVAVGAGRLEIRTRRRTAMGDMTKITVVDAARGLVLAQHLYDPQGQPIATAITSNHIRDGMSGVNMPRQIDLQLPSTQLQMRIDIVDWKINTLGPEHAGIWVKPEYADKGFPNVDLADPSLQFTMPGQPLSGAALNPRANGGLRAEGAGWSGVAENSGRSGAQMPLNDASTALRDRRMRLRDRFAPGPSVGAGAPAGSPLPPSAQAIAPPVVELPTGAGSMP